MTGSNAKTEETVTAKTGTMKITSASSSRLVGTFDYAGDLMKGGTDTSTQVHFSGSFSAIAG